MVFAKAEKLQNSLLFSRDSLDFEHCRNLLNVLIMNATYPQICSSYLVYFVGRFPSKRIKRCLHWSKIRWSWSKYGSDSHKSRKLKGEKRDWFRAKEEKFHSNYPNWNFQWVHHKLWENYQKNLTIFQVFKRVKIIPIWEWF